jgi:hypothetical protein
VLIIRRSELIIGFADAWYLDELNKTNLFFFGVILLKTVTLSG